MENKKGFCLACIGILLILNVLWGLINFMMDIHIQNKENTIIEQLKICSSSDIEDRSLQEEQE